MLAQIFAFVEGARKVKLSTVSAATFKGARLALKRAKSKLVIYGILCCVLTIQLFIVGTDTAIICILRGASDRGRRNLITSDQCETAIVLATKVFSHYHFDNHVPSALSLSIHCLTHIYDLTPKLSLRFSLEF